MRARPNAVAEWEWCVEWAWRRVFSWRYLVSIHYVIIHTPVVCCLNAAQSQALSFVVITSRVAPAQTTAGFTDRLVIWAIAVVRSSLYRFRAQFG